MPVRPLALLGRRRARPRSAPRMPRISHCESRRAGRLRRGHPRGADGRRGPGSRTCLGRRCYLRTAALGATRWTSSLRAIRASRSPSRASAGARTTRATSGRMRKAPADARRAAARSAAMLVLAGAPIVDLASLIREELQAILIDTVRAAVLNALGYWRLARRDPDRRCFALPPSIPSLGIEASSARRIASDVGWSAPRFTGQSGWG